MDYKNGQILRTKKNLTDFSIERILSVENNCETIINNSNFIYSTYSPYYYISTNVLRSSLCSNFVNETVYIGEGSLTMKDDNLKCNICGKVFAFNYNLSVSK